jgi:hypothetical protein
MKDKDWLFIGLLENGKCKLGILIIYLLLGNIDLLTLNQKSSI